MNMHKLLLLGTMAAALAAAGCSGGGDSTAQEPANPPSTPPTQPDPAPQPKAEVFTTWLKDGVLAKGEDDSGLPQAMDDITFDHSGNDDAAVFAGVIPATQPVIVPPDADAGT